MSLHSANSGSELRSGDGGALWQDAKSALARLWQGVLDLVLILWVVRAPFGGVLLGFLIIAKTPQAEDLLIPVADSNPLGIVVFLILHFVLWATPTHYSARLLLNDDRRFRLYMRSHKSRFGKLSELWVPRLLGTRNIFCHGAKRRPRHKEFANHLGSTRHHRRRRQPSLVYRMVAGFCALISVVRRETKGYGPFIDRQQSRSYGDQGAAGARPLGSRNGWFGSLAFFRLRARRQSRAPAFDCRILFVRVRTSTRAEPSCGMAAARLRHPSRARGMAADTDVFVCSRTPPTGAPDRWGGVCHCNLDGMARKQS